ncbi:MAG: hypothetical protein A3F72_18200 [Bacteroidetes bacterium RIFCSPLOWO2_12_FULL_35_15]|nr:MAG: hypothetical protein A3F72_18200 [Bacteroidetes bacterium RIFCSPLOWO2_12_FULL_35_15]
MNNYYQGVDIGSSYTKLTVIDEDDRICYQNIVKTLNRDKQELANILTKIKSQFNIVSVCATGYGREHFKDSHINKTEIYCASVGVSALYPEVKTIIDIGGEDIKVIKSDADSKVDDFYMNTKCAAGTGTFIIEIAERAELPLSRLSELAAKSDFDKELNSFCTVFAKTEIMKWIFDEVPEHDLARGIYISIVNRIAKIRMDKTLPIFLIGGVIQYHPFLKTIVEEKFKQRVVVPENPQMINSFGAALLAKKHAESEMKVKTI